jgi:hypothetical protein
MPEKLKWRSRESRKLTAQDRGECGQRIKLLTEFSGSLGSFDSGNPGLRGLTTEGTEGHRGLLELRVFGPGRPALWAGWSLLGTLIVHSPRFTQVDFSVRVRCHKEKINIGVGLWKTFGLVVPIGRSRDRCGRLATRQSRALSVLHETKSPKLLRRLGSDLALGKNGGKSCKRRFGI